MTRPYRFSVQANSNADHAVDDNDHQVFSAAAKRIEALGYEEFYTADHIGGADPFIPLIAGAAATTTLRFGTLVINNELHNPVMLARTVVTADQYSNGRMVLGLGTGYDQSEHDAADILLRPPGARVNRFEESVLIRRSLMDTGNVAHEGEHFTINVEDLGISPIQSSIPILIGGHGRRVVGVAGRHADIFQFTGLTHGPDGNPSAGGFAMEALRLRSDWLTEASGDRRDSIECSALVQRTVIGADADKEIAAVVERTGLDEATVRDTPFFMIGSVEQIVDKIERRRSDLGITHYVVREPDQFAPVVARLTA